MKYSYLILAGGLILAMPFASQAAMSGMTDEIAFYDKAEVRLNQTDTTKSSEHCGLRYVNEELNSYSFFGSAAVQYKF